jgi:hypothetical protein
MLKGLLLTSSAQRMKTGAPEHRIGEKARSTVAVVPNAVLRLMKTSLRPLEIRRRQDLP